MNAIEMNAIEPEFDDFESEFDDFEEKPIVDNIELDHAQIDAVVDIWSKYYDHISDDIFCEEGGYCVITYQVLLMKMLECGTKLRDSEERRHFISLLNTLMKTIYNLKEGTIQDFTFVTNLYCDIHCSYGMKASLNLV
jgi:hypothetical protein